MNAYVWSTVFVPFKAFIYIVTSRPVWSFLDNPASIHMRAAFNVLPSSLVTMWIIKILNAS